jgi:predicted Rossmann fold flavoprotein
MRALDVVSTLERHILQGGLQLRKNSQVSSLAKGDDGVFVIKCSEGFECRARKVIVATGGLSYQTTGSSGDGYAFAKGLGHKITPLFPSLTALKPKNYKEEFYGISLKNVSVQLAVNGDVVQEEFGDLDFTNGGIEGPIGFKVSRKGVHSIINGQKVELRLDMKPAVSLEQLAKRIEREAAEIKGDKLKGILPKLLPAKLVKLFVEGNNGLSMANLAQKLKCWVFPINDYVGYERCVVTAGGVSLQEVSQKTMESKLVPGLYFAGEVLDLDGDTGGYNLQIAFSTGALAAQSAAASLTR